MFSLYHPKPEKFLLPETLMGEREKQKGRCAGLRVFYRNTGQVLCTNEVIRAGDTSAPMAYTAEGLAHCCRHKGPDQPVWTGLSC